MIISGYSLSVSWRYAQFYAQVGAAENSQLVQEPVPKTPPETAPEPDSEAGQSEEEKIRGENGVLRLLQEGHFKPHAEMRLREIFHRDLELLGAQNANTTPPEENPETPPQEAAPAEAETI
jgi:hypothetical protein